MRQQLTALLSGDAQAALTIATEAQERFAGAKQHESQWRAWLIEARAAEKTGDVARAQQFAQQASTVLRNLEQEWGTEHYKIYLTRSSVQQAQGVLRRLLAQR